MPFTRPRHWLRWLIGSVVVLAVLAVTAPFVYIHFFNGSTSAALSLPSAGATASGSSTPTTGTVAAGGSVGGTWTVGSGSTAGYRVNENLLGQNTTAVGRTTAARSRRDQGLHRARQPDAARHQPPGHVHADH